MSARKQHGLGIYQYWHDPGFRSRAHRETSPKFVLPLCRQCGQKITTAPSGAGSSTWCPHYVTGIAQSREHGPQNETRGKTSAGSCCRSLVAPAHPSRRIDPKLQHALIPPLQRASRSDRRTQLRERSRAPVGLGRQRHRPALRTPHSASAADLLPRSPTTDMAV